MQGEPAQVLACRLVSPTWRDFIDLEAGRGWSVTTGHPVQVLARHPDTLAGERWREGRVEHSLIYCGGEVATIASDQTRVYAALRHGEVKGRVSPKGIFSFASL